MFLVLREDPELGRILTVSVPTEPRGAPRTISQRSEALCEHQGPPGLSEGIFSLENFLKGCRFVVLLFAPSSRTVQHVVRGRPEAAEQSGNPSLQPGRLRRRQERTDPREEETAEQEQVSPEPLLPARLAPPPAAAVTASVCFQANRGFSQETGSVPAPGRRRQQAGEQRQPQVH